MEDNLLKWSGMKDAEEEKESKKVRKKIIAEEIDYQYQAKG